MDFEKLFTINASEVKPDNDWTKEFLQGWTSTFEPNNLKKKLSHREIIIVEPREKIYLEPNKPISDSFIEKSFKLFAIYSSILPREINYYEDYYIAREEIKQIVRIHERMHAFHHVNSDGVWDNFGNTSPVYLEFLAQIFTFKCVQGTFLEPHFTEFSTIQPYIYQTWEAATDLTNEEVIGLYNEIKKNGTTTFGDLNKVAVWYDSITPKHLNSGFNKLTLAHDENFRNDELFQHCKINNAVAETMNDIW